MVSQPERAAPSQSTMRLLLDAELGLPQEREARLAEASAEHEALEQDAACWTRVLRRAWRQKVPHEQHAFREAYSYFARACQAWFDRLFRLDVFDAAHIGNEHIRNLDRAIGLLIILNDRSHGTANRKT